MTQVGSGAERLYELMIKRALWGIDTGESREMARLCLEFPDVDVSAVDRTVASLDAIELGPTPPLPAALREAIESEAPAPRTAAVPETVRASSRLPWTLAAVATAVAIYALLRCA